MSGTTSVVWGTHFTGYNFGEGHPMAPLRLELTARLCQSFDLFDQPNVSVIDPGVASDEVIATIASDGFADAVRAASLPGAHPELTFGLGTEDCPIFEGMHEASARLVAGTVESCSQVWSGQAEHAVNFTGGMHHAARELASGFCIYNDIAAGIHALLAQGAQRVAYIDIDVHHGDGVEEFFRDDPRVLTASIHESGRTLFPGTGWPAEIGEGAAKGTIVNLALPPGVGDAGWLRALDSGILPVVRAFQPEIIVSQHGCDTHALDPLAHLILSIDAQRRATDSIHKLAHEVSGGKWVALGGGGYDPVSVVPRSWTHLTAIAAHHPIPARMATPEQWRDAVRELTFAEPPERMGDVPESELPIWVQPWEMGYNPHSEVDRAIMATREAVFPCYGLDVWFG